MDKMSVHVGSKLRAARMSLDMSLDDAAKATGVSKAMLGQIERNESNPTVSTLWKISSGLRIPFSKLLNDVPQQYQAMGLDSIQPIYEEEGRIILYNLFPFDPISGFDYFFIRLLPGCRYTSPSRPSVTNEYIVVTEGILELTVDEQLFALHKGMSIRLQGDVRHIYANVTDAVCEFQNIIKY